MGSEMCIRDRKAAHYARPSWEHVYFGAPHNAALRTAPGAGFRRRIVRWSEWRAVVLERPRARGAARGAALALAAAAGAALALAVRRRR